MPSNRQHQMSLLARFEREERDGAVLTMPQQRELAKMLAELLLQAARLAEASRQEEHDE